MAKDKTVKARVLADCQFGLCNDVVELSEADARVVESLGMIDCDPDAVAYAESLRESAE